ncbi:MAG: FAD-binding protein [Acidobacteria bacterium]|nr:FAD-binding protein [Acidobacteriota bacterium]
MSLVQLSPAASALERALRAAPIDAEIRFDSLTRALYSTDASPYQLHPQGLVLPRSREALIATVRTAARLRAPITLRGGGTSQAGQAIGEGLVIDTSKYYNKVLEVNAAERWVRVEPGIVLDELNAALKVHNLRFAPDISTASRATVGGMMANNSAGARSVLYGKTIDHVLEQTVLLSDGSIAHFGPTTAEEAGRGDTYAAHLARTVHRIATDNASEVERRFPKVLRRVGGYNLDCFVPQAGQPFNLSKLMVGSEGTLGVVLEAKLNLVPLPKHKSVLTIQFSRLLDALGATPAILQHKPSAVEVMDAFILDNTRQSPRLEEIRRAFIQGEPGALLCVEFYADRAEKLAPRMQALEADLRARQTGDHFFYALDLATQQKVWSLREAALGLSMAQKGDAKSLSFVEDTAVAPERLAEYIGRFLQIIRKHGTVAGVYAHASVGCLHVRPVVNMKTAAGVAKFQAIANDVADLVLEYGGALSGEHGDGLVRSPFMEKMFGPRLYAAFGDIKRAFDPHGIFNPGKIVGAPALTSNLRFGAGYESPRPETHFDYSDYGGFGGAVEMCSGVGACRKKLDGTMCPSYMATHEETDSTRGRANVLRLALLGKLEGETDDAVYRALDLCLECRACKSECPVGVDVARFKSEFLAGYWERHGAPIRERLFAHAHKLARLGSTFAPLSNWIAAALPAPGIARERRVPAYRRQTLERLFTDATPDAPVLLFKDTFTNHYAPEVGLDAARVLRAAGHRVGLAPNLCCGRPLISKGFLGDARRLAEEATEALYPLAERGKRFVFCEPSCLSSVKEDVPALLRGEMRRQAEAIAARCTSFEELALTALPAFTPGPRRVLLHGHCHQKSMGLLAPAKALLEKIPGAAVQDLDAGCCGMAGSFGYAEEHFDVSRKIASRKLLPAVRGMQAGDVLVAAGTSCRHQVEDLAAAEAIHPATLLGSLLAR